MSPLLILSDTTDYGGHEIAFFSFFERFIEQGIFSSYHFVISNRNERLLRRVREFQHGNIFIIESPYCKRRAEPYLAPFRLAYQMFIRSTFKQIQPKTTLMLQGRIENLCVAAIALPKHADIVSYLPMAHSIGEMRMTPFAGIQDIVRRFYYRRPGRFIVPSDSVLNQIRTQGFAGQIYTARNWVAPIEKIDKTEARRILGLNVDKKYAAFIGRFDSDQKGIDNLLEIMSAEVDWDYLFVGEGPYREKITQRAMSDCNLRVLPWTDRVGEYLRAIDVLLLPSRFEGVPLIMLQAIRAETPILASEIDVFYEYLPEENLVKFKGGMKLHEVLDAVSSTSSRQSYSEHCRLISIDKIEFDKSLDAFSRGIRGAV